jgi:D-alanyl-D-alanine carboxypeptidase/D-alanyl-D-alanine-endopeptidase (penicillin-binding protein 4)
MGEKVSTRLIWWVVLSAVVFSTLLVAAATRSAHNAEPKVESVASPTNSRRPIPSAKAEGNADAEVGQAIDKAIDSSEFTNARWGVCVVSLRDGRTIYTRNADKLFTPASNMKLYTTAVALDLLGPEFQWRTSVYAQSAFDANGTLAGDLTLYGRGAPDLYSHSRRDNSASLAQLADDLFQKGLRHIKGNVVGDESYFRAEAFGNGWQWNDLQWYFGAEPSALTINDNQIDVEIKPSENAGEQAQARLTMGEDYAHVINELTTVKRGEQMTVGINRGITDNEIRVWGEIPLGTRTFGYHLSVHDPAKWAAKLLLTALRARGIAVDGEARARDFRVPASDRFDPAKATELAMVLSRPLSEVVKATNKESINLNAELILRTLGRERGQLAPDNDAHKNYERGDDEAGLVVIRQWLNRAQVKTESLALHDGSGLSRLDLVTPEATAHLLLATSRAPAASIFYDSLPSAGVDGTLGGRLGKYKGMIAAKTGSLVYDHSLSGFVNTAGGEALAFSVMCNDQTTKGSSTRLIDQIVGILADYGPGTAEKP